VGVFWGWVEVCRCSNTEIPSRLTPVIGTQDDFHLLVEAFLSTDHGCEVCWENEGVWGGPGGGGGGGGGFKGGGFSLGFVFLVSL